MKKLNNKGFTVVELTLSFVLVFTLAFSMYQLLFNYRVKQNEESIKAQLTDYRDQVTLAIQNDISDKKLKNIDYCMMGSNVVDRCLVLNFNDGTSKQLAVEKGIKTYNGEDYDINYITYGGIIYESSDAILLEYRANYMLYNTYESDNLEDSRVNVYKISIPIYHNDLEGNYGIEIVAVGYNYDYEESGGAIVGGGSITPPAETTTAEGRVYNGYTTSTNYSLNSKVTSQTIVARLKFSSIGTYQQFFGNWQLGGSGLTLGVSASTPNNKFCYGAYISTGKAFDNKYTTVCATSEVSANTFYTVVGTFDQADNKMKIYVNGTLISSKTLSSGSYITASSLPFTVGGNIGQAKNTSYFYGTSSNVLIYDKALSAATISTCLTNSKVDTSCVASSDSTAKLKVNEDHTK